MNPWIAIGVFSVTFAYDLVYIFFIRYLRDDSRLTCAMLSGLMQALVCFEVIMYAGVDSSYAAPTIAGAVIGTPVAMFLDKKLRVHEKKLRDKKTGKFKPEPSLARQTSQFDREVG